MPVSLDMKFIPPHPFSVNMALERFKKTVSISDHYWKVVKFLAQYGVELSWINPSFTKNTVRN